MPDLECRVAKLEERVSNKIEEDDDYRTNVTVALKDISASIHDLKETNARQKGFMGGIIFAISAISTIVTVVINKYF